MKYLFAVCITLLTSFGFAHAQITDPFFVSQQITGDLVPPTTPVLVSAIPIASTQIDLSWNASTDDEQLGGYVVFRDAVQIATTTLTTYSDTGLSASTTYSYFVRAFDVSYNYSSSSNSIATTTLQAPATSTPVTSNPDADVSIDLIDLQIAPHVYSADLSWETDRYARYELRWGRTGSYEQGFVINETFKRNHMTTISGLEPGTRYEFQIVAYNRDGQGFTLKQGVFTTLDLPDLVPPTNIFNFRGVINGDDVDLYWNSPQDADFSYVRIVRSHLFYPTDPYDGFIVYQGDAVSHTDTKAGLQKRVLYYTAFAYDENGNVSSGASIAVYPPGVIKEEDPYGEDDLRLTFADFEILQEGALIRDGELAPGVPFLVRIAYEKLPKHLKTITAQFTYPDTSHSSLYLLRINKDSTFYEAMIPGFTTKGTYPTILSLYDHQTKKAQVVTGELYVRADLSVPHIPFFGPILANVDQGLIVDVWFYIVLFLLLFGVFELVRAFMGKGYRMQWRAFHRLHIFALFSFGALLSYVLFSLRRVGEHVSHTAQVSAGLFENAEVLFAYTLLGALGLLVFVALRTFFTRF